MNNRNKLKNIEQANLMLEQYYLKSKTTIVSETIFLPDLTDSDYIQILKEASEENNIKIVLNESKILLKESVALVIGAALASGKLLDVIGSLFRGAYNLFMKTSGLMKKMRENKCKTDSQQEQANCIEELLKKQLINKTWLEKAGEWIHKNIIIKIFKGIAIVLIGIFAPAFIIDKKEGGLNNELVEKVANTLFYSTITIFAIYGGYMLIKHGLHGLVTLPGVVESVAVGTKAYELVLLIGAAILISYKKVKETSPSSVAHKLGECLEGGGKVSKILGNIKKIKKDYEYRKQIYACIDLQETH